MSLVRDLHFVLYLALLPLVWLVTRQRREHLPLALFVSWMVFTDWTRIGLRAIHHGEPRPLVGIPRVAFHLDQFVVLSWSFATMALAIRYFTKKSTAIAFAGLAMTWLITLNYPLVTGDVLLWIMRFAGICGSVVSWACILWAITRRRDLEPTLAHLVVILIATTDFVTYLVPWMTDPRRTWPIVNLVDDIQLAIFCAAHVIWLVSRRRLARA